MIDDRIGHLLKTHGHPGELIMSPLNEPAENASQAEFEYWDRTCDRCGTYCHPEQAYFTGHIELELHNYQVILTYGLCAACADKHNKEAAE